MTETPKPKPPATRLYRAGEQPVSPADIPQAREAQSGSDGRTARPRGNSHAGARTASGGAYLTGDVHPAQQRKLGELAAEIRRQMENKKHIS